MLIPIFTLFNFQRTSIYEWIVMILAHSGVILEDCRKNYINSENKIVNETFLFILQLLFYLTCLTCLIHCLSESSNVALNSPTFSLVHILL